MLLTKWTNISTEILKVNIIVTVGLITSTFTPKSLNMLINLVKLE